VLGEDLAVQVGEGEFVASVTTRACLDRCSTSIL
jgi:hypothetical protein